ncbi:MAG: Type III pantothenate kinase [Calditrichaeota bacterium]|nr:Type III pantothenate kinase [Calditrichota bacterium]
MSGDRSGGPLLALDIGNTHVQLGLFDGDALRIRRKLSSNSTRTSDEAGVLVTLLCRDSGVDPKQLAGVGIASVAPRTGQVYAEMSESYLGHKPFFVHGELPGFVNHYRNPRAVGADRVSNAVAGYAKYGGPLLVLDFGTAITFDVIGGAGEYLGGVILPGLETSAGMLKRTTALLPEARLKVPRHVIGRTTDQSIQAGLVRGTIHALRGMISDLRAEMDEPEAKVVATGGMARMIVPHLPEVNEIAPDLVLEGIRILYKQHRG